MRRYSVWYFLQQGFINLWRNSVMSLASVMVLMSCLVVMGGFALLVYNIDYNIGKIGLMNEIVVFLEYELESEQSQAIRDRVATMDNVISVELIPKEAGLEEMRRSFYEYGSIFDIYNEGDNPLADSLYITYRDNELVSTLDYQLRQTEGIRKVNNRLDLSVTIENFKNGISIVFLWFLAVLFIVSIFVIINTIKLAVFSRRNEIGVMRYIGSTKFFITAPFIIEGILIGVTASILAYLIEWYFYSYIERLIIAEMQMLEIFSFAELSFQVLAGFVFVGILTGIIGSITSLSKYLKN